MKNFTLKQLFFVIVLFEILLMILIVFFLMKNISIIRELVVAEKNRFYMNQAAVNLKQSSDDLTRFARLYVVTGKREYLENFYEVLNVRNGNGLSSKKNDKSHGHNAGSSGKGIDSTESPKSFLSIVHSLPCTDEERKLLCLSLNKSDALVNTEERAFSIIKKLLRRAPLEHSPEKGSGFKYALGLVHGHEYLKAKERIMVPLNMFTVSMNRRTLDRINNLNRNLVKYGDVFKTVLGIFIVYNLFILMLLHRRVIKPLLNITGQIKSISASDFGHYCHINCGRSDRNDEIGILVNEFNHLHSEISERTEMLEQSYEKVMDLHRVIDNYIIISETDIDGTIIYASDAFCRISGYSKDELLGQNHRIVQHSDTPQEFFVNMWETISSGKVWKGQLKNRNRNGNEYWVDAVIEPVLNRNGQICGYRSIRIDVDDKKRIEYLSVTDKLTGLYNRLKLDEVFQYELERSGRYENSFSVILIDVDKFKSVNDAYGHQAGDVVLCGIADIIKQNVRVIDTAGRWGGEEFLILCPETDNEQAFVIAEKLRIFIESFTFAGVGKRTASFGIASYTEGDTKESIMYRADMALYSSKKNGRNRVSFADR